MSVIGEIRASLDAMGLEQQLFMFAFLTSYPLAIGAMLHLRGRRIAAGVAGASAIGFTVMTQPWIHGVLLIVVAVGGIGVVIVAACAVEQVQRRVAPDTVFTPDTEPMLDAPLPAAPIGRDVGPLPAPVLVKL